jgi:hypothetical protein
MLAEAIDGVSVTMIDDPRTVAELMGKLESHLPIPARPTGPLVRQLRARGSKLMKDRVLFIRRVFYLGDEGGIMCDVTPSRAAKEAIVVSLTHLHIAPDHPLFRDIRVYQLARIRRLAESDQVGSDQEEPIGLARSADQPELPLAEGHARSTKQRRLGKQPPRYRFFLNPYPDVRFTTCPQCGRRTNQRKLPLVIHVDPRNPVSINKTCRYCPGCDLLIAHKHEVEQQLELLFARHNPSLIGNDYLVVGTQDRADWRRGVQTPLTIQEMLDSLHDFKEVMRFETAYR